MNSYGQFLLYDALLAFLILLVVLVGMAFVLSTEDDALPDSNVALDRLILLSSIDVHDTNLLLSLSANDSSARSVVCDVLAEDSFVIRDLTLNKTLINKKSGDYVDVFSARKVIGGHEYELMIYV